MRPLITESSLRLAYFFFQLALKSPFASAQSYRVPILCGSLESLPEVTYTFSSVYYHFITSKYNCQFLLPILFVNFCNFACAPEILSVKPETVAQKKISVFIAVCLSVSKFLMVSSFYTVLLTTNFSEMILGLQKWKIPYSIAFGIGLVFQIIPLIIDELRAIMEAQSSRGLEIDECNWITKTKNYITFSLPLLFRVISKGQAISLAMHYYRLDFSVKRTAYKSIHASKYDVYFALANIAAVAMTIFLRFCFYIPV